MLITDTFFHYIHEVCQKKRKGTEEKHGTLETENANLKNGKLLKAKDLILINLKTSLLILSYSFSFLPLTSSPCVMV